MPYPIIRLAATGFLLMMSCTGGQTSSTATPNSGVESLYTSLKTSSCTEATDPDDADDLSYLVCPGVAGYRLQIRTVESGRLSINLVTPAKRLVSLRYQDVVTRSMDDVDERAEWRIRRENGKVVPIALIVRVMAHEDHRNPERVTNTYWAVAKIDGGKACVTDSIREGSKPAADVRTLADSAASRPCAARLPATAAATRSARTPKGG